MLLAQLWMHPKCLSLTSLFCDSEQTNIKAIKRNTVLKHEVNITLIVTSHSFPSLKGDWTRSRTLIPHKTADSTKTADNGQLTLFSLYKYESTGIRPLLLNLELPITTALLAALGTTISGGYVLQIYVRREKKNPHITTYQLKIHEKIIFSL